MRQRIPSYDSKCYDLSQAFLMDERGLNTETNRKELAGTIQTCIEEWIYYARRRYEQHQ